VHLPLTVRISQGALFFIEEFENHRGGHQDGLILVKIILELACEEKACQRDVEEQENPNQSAHSCFGAFKFLWRQFSLVQRFVLPFYLLAIIEEPPATPRLNQNIVTISTLHERHDNPLAFWRCLED
jgi:hypothetical protein